MKNITVKLDNPTFRAETIAITQDDFQTLLAADLNDTRNNARFVTALEEALELETGGFAKETVVKIVPFVKIPSGGDYSGSTLDLCDFDEGSLFLKIVIKTK